MALIKYTARVPPTTDLRTYLYEELRLIQTAITSLAHETHIISRTHLSQADIGAEDSGGPGYRLIRLPNEVIP